MNEALVRNLQLSNLTVRKLPKIFGCIALRIQIGSLLSVHFQVWTTVTAWLWEHCRGSGLIIYHLSSLMTVDTNHSYRREYLQNLVVIKLKPWLFDLILFEKVNFNFTVDFNYLQLGYNELCCQRFFVLLWHLYLCYY